MKKLFSILLILISLNSFSQFNKAKLKKLGYYTLAISTDAIGDALNDNGNKELGHAFNAASVGIHLYIPFDKDLNFETFRDFALDATIYAGLRYAIFNLIYNWTAGLPWNYVGNSDYVDQLTRELGQFSKVVTLTFIIGLERNR